MGRLILTTNSSGAGHIGVAGLADLVVALELLDGLAHCPAPAIADLNEGPFTMELHDDRERHRRYKQSKLSLTELGKAILAGTDDFSRHNPIHRWWGATELTNARLWCWDPANRTLVAP